MRDLVAEVGFDPDYYTAIHRNFDLPYDFYRPDVENHALRLKLSKRMMAVSLSYPLYPPSSKH